MLLAGDGSFLQRVGFQGGGHPKTPARDWVRDASPFSAVIVQLREYFAGLRQQFDLQLLGHGTRFQQAVWHELCLIPYGQTISYGELAHRIGNPKASRAVGLANGANPLPIIVPCHRVVNTDGSLGGFGGGSSIKRRLLDIERGWPMRTDTKRVTKIAQPS